MENPVNYIMQCEEFNSLFPLLLAGVAALALAGVLLPPLGLRFTGVLATFLGIFLSEGKGAGYLGTNSAYRCYMVQSPTKLI